MFVFVKDAHSLPRLAYEKHKAYKKYEVLSSSERYLILKIPQEDGGIKHIGGEFGWEVHKSSCTDALFEDGDIVEIDERYVPYSSDFSAYEVAYQDSYHVVVKLPKKYGGYTIRPGFDFCWTIPIELCKKVEIKSDIFYLGKKVKIDAGGLKNLPSGVANAGFVFTIGAASKTGFFLFVDDQELGYTLEGEYFIDGKPRTGFWVDKKYVLHASDEDIKKFENLIAQETKNGKVTTIEILKTNEISFSSKEVRNYEMLLPNLVNLAKSIFKWTVAFALKQFGKSKKIASYMEVIEDLVDTHKDAANSLFQWILGIASKYAHKIRALPGMDRIEFLQILESEQLKKFGQYAESVSEGEVIGTLVAKTLSWVQEKISSSNLSEKFGKILEGQVDATAVARFATDVSSHLDSETNGSDFITEESAQMTAAI